MHFVKKLKRTFVSAFLYRVIDLTTAIVVADSMIAFDVVPGFVLETVVAVPENRKNSQVFYLTSFQKNVSFLFIVANRTKIVPVQTIKLVIGPVVIILDETTKLMEYLNLVVRIVDTRSIGGNLANWTDNTVFPVDFGTMALQKISID